jgi:hypothetical protein
MTSSWASSPPGAAWSAGPPGPSWPPSPSSPPAALAAGRLHPSQLRIIEEATRYLSDEDAARADELLAGTAGSKTSAQLRYAAHRLVLKLDPGAAQRRKDAARGEAHVRRFREDSGNAG